MEPSRQVPSAARVPSTVRASALGSLIAPTLAGSRLSLEPGETLTSYQPPAVTEKPPTRVVWVDGADEVLIHLDSVMARTVGITLLISIDLETDETGGAVAFVDRMNKAGWTYEIRSPSWLVAAGVGICRVPLPA